MVSAKSSMPTWMPTLTARRTKLFCSRRHCPVLTGSLEKLIGHNWAFYSATNLQIAINRGANPKINSMELRIWMSQEFPKLLTDKLLHLAESFLQFRQIVNCICQRDRIVGGLQTIFQPALRSRRRQSEDMTSMERTLR